MIDVEKIKEEGIRLREQVGSALRISLDAEQANRLYEEAIGPAGMALFKTFDFFAQEADRCRQANCWFTASLMCASAIEGLLGVFCLLSENEVSETKTFARMEGSTYQDKVLRASFDKMIDIAAILDWIPSDALSPEVLTAAKQDYPLFAANMYSSFVPQRRTKRAADFVTAPGIEMLRILQDLRNLIHPSRWPRLNVSLKGTEFESDCKFCYLLTFEVFQCLVKALSTKTQNTCSKIEQMYESLNPEMRVAMSKAVEAIISMKKH